MASPSPSASRRAGVGVSDLLQRPVGHLDKPSFSPSLLIRGTKFSEKGNADFNKWHADGCPKLPDGYKFDSVDIVCHSWVTDGMIKFFEDSTHELAGQTLPLQEF